MKPAPEWPMPRPQEQDNPTLISEAARVLGNCETQYTRDLAAEIKRRLG